MKKFLFIFLLSLSIAIPGLTVYADSPNAKVPVFKGPVRQINEYFTLQSTTYSDGSILEEGVIKGPPKPPPGQVRRTTVLLPEPMPEMGVNTLTVPAFNWVFGCSAVSASMIAGYYDRNGFPNIYTGPTDGGIIPLAEDSSWGTWTDSKNATYPNNPLIASHLGLDGRTVRGSIDDYWVSYLSNSKDPYVTGGWTQHPWGDAVGDYMKTSQSAYNNVDGSTSFYHYSSSTPLSCGAMETFGIASNDGNYGRKLFYQARGYTVTDCYTQMTDNQYSGGFSFAQYKTEIDAGRPVLLNLNGHSIVGVGYDDSTQTVYINDTWDNSTHTMPWGGSYSGMALWGVSIVNLQNSSNTPNILSTPSSYNFGNVAISNTPSQTFTISNTGTGNLTIGTITINGPQSSEFSKTGDTCSGQTIASSSTCTVQVKFSPVSVGTKSATMAIPSNDPDQNPLNVSLNGAGVTTVNVSINPANGGTVTGTGINCPGDCSETYPSVSTLTLTASPAQGFTFKSWTGCPAVNGNQCTVTTDVSRTVTAEFQSVAPTLPDLSGQWSNVSWAGPRKGVYTVSGTFTTTNAGSVTLYNVLVNLSFPGAPLKSYTYKSMAPNSSKATTVRFSVTADPRPKFLTGVIDPNNSISESNESNNTVTSAPLN
jgi:hypothetical protein